MISNLFVFSGDEILENCKYWNKVTLDVWFFYRNCIYISDWFEERDAKRICEIAQAHIGDLLGKVIIHIEDPKMAMLFKLVWG